MGFKEWNSRENDLPLVLEDEGGGTASLNVVTQLSVIPLLRFTGDGIMSVPGTREKLEDEDMETDCILWGEDGEAQIGYPSSESPEDESSEESGEEEEEEEEQDNE